MNSKARFCLLWTVVAVLQAASVRASDVSDLERLPDECKVLITEKLDERAALSIRATNRLWYNILAPMLKLKRLDLTPNGDAELVFRGPLKKDHKMAVKYYGSDDGKMLIKHSTKVALENDCEPAYLTLLMQDIAMQTKGLAGQYSRDSYESEQEYRIGQLALLSTVFNAIEQISDSGYQAASKVARLGIWDYRAIEASDCMMQINDAGWIEKEHISGARFFSQVIGGDDNLSRQFRGDEPYKKYLSRCKNLATKKAREALSSYSGPREDQAFCRHIYQNAQSSWMRYLHRHFLELAESNYQRFLEAFQDIQLSQEQWEFVETNLQDLYSADLRYKNSCRSLVSAEK